MWHCGVADEWYTLCFLIVEGSYWGVFFCMYSYLNPTVFPLGLRWAFWGGTGIRCLSVPEWRWRGGGVWGVWGAVEPEIYGLKGDWLVPSLALMYGWQSPPPSPSHLLTHTLAHTQTSTCNYTVQLHIHPDTAQGPRAFPDSPPELLHVKL